MSLPTDPANANIAVAATSPVSATFDGQSVTDRSADDLIKLRNDQAGQTAMGKAAFGLRFTKIVPPGAG